jgi:hypothetical protein
VGRADGSQVASQYILREWGDGELALAEETARDMGGANRMGQVVETIRELPGVVVPLGAARSGGCDMVPLRVTLPARTGQYKLMVDVVQESVCWFSDRGSPPLELPLSVA